MSNIVLQQFKMQAKPLIGFMDKTSGITGVLRFQGVNMAISGLLLPQEFCYILTFWLTIFLYWLKILNAPKGTQI